VDGDGEREGGKENGVGELWFHGGTRKFHGSTRPGTVPRGGAGNGFHGRLEGFHFASMFRLLGVECLAGG
jgi:hypothetical protein